MKASGGFLFPAGLSPGFALSGALPMLQATAILFFLWAIHLAPPLLAALFGKRLGAPVDGGTTLSDGRPLFGPHKTWRGIAGALLAGGLLGAVLPGFTWGLGLFGAALGMAGDLATSFLKRRLGLQSGAPAPWLDQALEGLLPLAVLAPAFSLGWGVALLVAALFGLGAWGGSHVLVRCVLSPPFPGYPRPLSLRVRLRELRACAITSRPLALLLHPRETLQYRVVLRGLLGLLGLHRRGRENALDVARRDLTLSFPSLPPAFDGYTILFMADLHLDGLPGLPERLRRIAEETPCDLSILGGDFRMEKHGPAGEALRCAKDLSGALRARDGVFAVLGNHDCLEMVEPLRDAGVRVLVNESEAVSRNGAALHVAGVDDPHAYRTDDVAEALSGVPPGAFAILVAHSPESFREAAARGAALYLCGHTHGGQIRLPFLGSVFTHSRAPRRTAGGLWSEGAMLGYTTLGAGASGLPVRFGTRGEVVLMTLRRRA